MTQRVSTFYTLDQAPDVRVGQASVGDQPNYYTVEVGAGELWLYVTVPNDGTSPSDTARALTLAGIRLQEMIRAADGTEPTGEANGERRDEDHDEDEDTDDEADEAGLDDPAELGGGGALRCRAGECDRRARYEVRLWSTAVWDLCRVHTWDAAAEALTDDGRALGCWVRPLGDDGLYEPLGAARPAAAPA